MDSPGKISGGSTLGEHNQGQLSTPALSPSSASSHAADGRPASPRPSISSIQSGKTEVEYYSDIQPPTKRKSGYRFISSDVEVKITYWQSLKSVLMPWQNRTRKVTAELQVVDPDEDMDDNNDHFCSPWIPSVLVLSKEKDSSNRYVQKVAQCTIDTANLQGNLVSRDFLLNELGFSVSDFKELKKSHRHGVSVSGHAVIPDGTVKLTWFHGNSPRVFREMRFFVVPNPLCELVLGAKAIQKYGILNPPNFQNGVASDISHVADTKDPQYLKLNQKMVEIEEVVADLALRLKDRDLKPERRQILENQKKSKEAELVIATKNRSDYVAVMNNRRKEAEERSNPITQPRQNQSRQAQNVPRFTLNVRSPSRTSTGLSISTPPHARRVVAHHS